MLGNCSSSSVLSLQAGSEAWHSRLPSGDWCVLFAPGAPGPQAQRKERVWLQQSHCQARTGPAAPCLSGIHRGSGGVSHEQGW